jgi:hypothetical protein
MNASTKRSRFCVLSPIALLLLLACGGGGGGDNPVTPTPTPTPQVKQWGTPKQLSNNLDAQMPDVPMDASGRGVIAWHQSDGSKYNIRADYYLPASGWGPTPAEFQCGTLSSLNPEVAISPDGYATIAWEWGVAPNRGINAVSGLMTAAGAEWSAGYSDVSRNATRASDCSCPKVAHAGQGKMAIVWQEDTGSTTDVLVSRYVTSPMQSTWVDAERLETGSEAARTPSVVMAPDGQIMAAWEQRTSVTASDMVARPYLPSTGWNTGVALDHLAGVVTFPAITMNASGSHAMAIWSQTGTNGDYIRADRYVEGTGWEDSKALGDLSLGNAWWPQVALNAAGDRAMAVWCQDSDGDGTPDVYACEFTAAGGWGVPTVLGATSVGSASLPRIAMDTQGNARAAWLLVMDAANSPSDVRTRSYKIGTGRGTLEHMESSSGIIALNRGPNRWLQLAMDPNGNAILVWQQLNGSIYDVWTNVYK